MKDCYQTLSDVDNIRSQAIEILKPLKVDHPSWLESRYTYIYSIIFNHLVDSKPKDMTSILNTWSEIAFSVFAKDEELRDVCRAIYPSIQSVVKARTVRSTVILLIQHLSARKLVAYDNKYFPNYQLNKPIADSQLFKSLPRIVLFFALIQTKKRYIEFSDRLTKAESELISSSKFLDLTTRTWNANTTAMRRCIFHMGLSSFSEITAEVLSAYKLDMGARGIDTTFNGLVPIASALSNNDLSRIIGSSSRTGKHLNGEPDSLEYRYLTKQTAFNLTGLNDVLVRKRKESTSLIEISDWSFLKNDLKHFSPESLNQQDTPWIKTQIDYLESGGFEIGSKKNISKSFSVLNVYLLSYLRNFFNKNNDLPYPYPVNIKDFHGFIYVTPSRILFESVFEQPIRKLPIGLLDFISELLKTNSLKGNKNAIRDTRARLRNYFDWVRDRYGSLDNFDLRTNPITKEDATPSRGSSYHHSNKALFQLEYWVLLKEFLLAVTEQLILDAENATDGTQYDYVTVNKTVTFGKTKLRIGKVRVNYFQQTSLKVSELKDIRVHSYQPFCALLIVASTGIRLSNAMWLDARTFDQLYDPRFQDEITNLFVNTDKAQIEPFESEIPIEVMELAKRANALRERVIGIDQKPFNYQENKDSKWGEILPLLQYAPRNRYSSIQDNLAKVLEEFEQCLKNSEIEFLSELFYAPSHISPKDFLHLRERNHVFHEKIHTVIWTEENAVEHEACFTPINLKTDLTPHSFRKTFDTYLPIIIGKKAAGEISTGQTPSTVGYYCTPTPQQEVQVKTIGKAIGIPHQAHEEYVSILKSTADEDKIVESLLSGGINGIQGFTLTSSRYKSDNVDKVIETCSAEQIAVNRTHICLYNNECPDHILDRLSNKKTCALCPVSIGTKHDGPAISAKIKFHCDRIRELNEHLTNDNLTKAEKTLLLNERSEEIRLAASWLVRHKYMISLINGERMIVLEDGLSALQSMRHKIPQSGTEAIIARLHEVEGIPTFQSNKLKKIADRMSRKLLKIINKDDFELPETNEVDVVVSLINKITDLYQLDRKQLVDLLDSHKSEQLHSYSVLLDALEES